MRVGITASAFDMLMLQGSSETVGTTANNFWALTGFTAGGSAADNSGASQTIMYLGASASGATTATSHVTIDITSPQLAQVTLLTVQAASLAGTYTGRQGMCSFNTAAQFDGFAIKTISATTLTGNVAIYGYRTA